MNLERLKIWIDALKHADAVKRKFDISTWIVETPARSPCSTVACAGGDLALYTPARELGLIVLDQAPFFRRANGEDLCGSDAIGAFLQIRTPRDREWVFATTSGMNAYGAYVDADGLPLKPSEITRNMVLRRIEAKIVEVRSRRRKERETA